MPVTKLISKKRIGSKVTKKYDKARTPFRRVLESEYIDDKIKARLKVQYDSLNPVELKKNISGLQEKVSLRQGCVGEYFLKKTTPVSPETNDFRLRHDYFASDPSISP